MWFSPCSLCLIVLALLAYRLYAKHLARLAAQEPTPAERWLAAYRAELAAWKQDYLATLAAQREEQRAEWDAQLVDYRRECDAYSRRLELDSALYRAEMRTYRAQLHTRF
jgi:hypothetical protein